MGVVYVLGTTWMTFGDTLHSLDAMLHYSSTLILGLIELILTFHCAIPLIFPVLNCQNTLEHILVDRCYCGVLQ